MALAAAYLAGLLTTPALYAASRWYLRVERRRRQTLFAVLRSISDQRSNVSLVRRPYDQDRSA